MNWLDKCARWAELKKDVWDSKKPVGLSDDYTYLNPGKTKEEGHSRVDFFVGEEELMRYLGRLDIETAAKAKKASKTPRKDPQPVQDPPECMANPTNRTEITSALIGRTLDVRELPQTGDADDVGSVTTSSQAPSTSQCRSTPSLKSDPLEASIMEDKSEPDEMEDACEPGETEDPTRNLNEQFSIVSDRSAVEGPRRSARIVANLSDVNIIDINMVHDLDDDDDYKVMELDAKNDDGASGDDDSDSEGELDGNTDNDQGEEGEVGEEEADGPLFDSSLIDAVGDLRFAHN
ncbi:hypothetical protein PC113_g20628 [Phytophthora cactorum]|uniref:Uncharacterized protein n=1 Tax=Phytophthora cactorum TaxID=29920 RepID=A0A8T0Y811_9STRA|nr:hypothetical protein PC113_g20628 [Phytophthora cactorum]